ncbi:MAG: Rieske (2Fe-2S) protein [Fuerstiella sp.]
MPHNTDTRDTGASADDESRRGFLERTAAVAMAGGLAAGYGTLAGHAVRFLYPADTGAGVWQFVCTLDRLGVGESLSFTMPSGARVVVARQSADDDAEAFIALSSICPHLGCKVHWEANNDRFFCPCHNGAFDARGAPTEGPPAAANQHLTRFPLSVQDNLLMIQVPLDNVTVSDEEATA